MSFESSSNCREILLAPLIVADKLGKVDVEAQVLEGPGGSTVIPRAVRHAVALGVAALYPETAEKLRLGMLGSRLLADCL